MMSEWPSTPMIGFGQVRHARMRPVVHAFAYAGYFLLLPMRSLHSAAAQKNGPLAINRRGWISFHDQDHGDARPVAQGGALGWIDELLAAHGIHDAQGEVWLQCYPRVLGYAFKPVSFWFCHRAKDNHAGALRAIVVEVNNTFGERHCYLLDRPGWGVEMTSAKSFHVSPFFQVSGEYRFRFLQGTRGDQLKTVARIDHGDAQGGLLKTSISGDVLPITRRALRRAAWSYPFMTVAVMARIHWQAFHLWRKRVSFFTKPSPPAQTVTRQVGSPTEANGTPIPLQTHSTIHRSVL